MMPKRTFSTGWSCCTCDSLYFCTNRRKNQTVSMSKTKACATNFLENQKFPMDLRCICFFELFDYTFNFENDCCAFG